MEEVGDDDTGPHSSLTERIDDDQPTLSAQALEALREFLGEQNRALLADDDGGGSNGVTSSSEVALLVEDWRLSQFWYDPETAETVAREVLSLCGSVEFPSVACIACPTLYAYLKKFGPSVSAQLLEYDKRFEQYGSEFTFYDYNQPEELPSSLKTAYQIVVADPPYLVRT
ncbi:hypothetical protein RHSIM_Rhsim03G0057000 [Rhododendron simsii]|uniref:Uncharacterized protein n=1 Tax=Rhododendron simsii TaxID=118357 RepID=A0A834LUF8_RHOSS|nr:hypothetical protein RHSIM_Rhsim03G0057000 [Rhododendron simsii]